MKERPAPMLARAVEKLPSGSFLYEPKWDGARCIAAVGHGWVQLLSRSGKRVESGFPEVTRGLSSLGLESATLDGELLVSRDGEFSFGALLSRLSSSNPDQATSATFVAFDLLELDGIDLSRQPLNRRRETLEEVVGRGAPGVTVSPATTDLEVAMLWFQEYVGPGIDGVMAKRLDWPYTPGRRTMFKCKREITLDCVIAGARRSRDGYSSLMLGLFNEDDELAYIGACSGFSGADERAIAERLRPLECERQGHPWHGLKTRAQWTALRPRQVCEVASTHYEHGRLRSPARFVRWRDDRDPASCRVDQLAVKREPSPC